jgi:hypothetical protein
MVSGEIQIVYENLRARFLKKKSDSLEKFKIDIFIKLRSLEEK